MAAASIRPKAQTHTPSTELSPFERGSKPFLVRLTHREMLRLSTLSKRVQQTVSEISTLQTRSLIEVAQPQLRNPDKAKLQAARIDVSDTLYHVLDLSIPPLTAEQERIFFPSSTPFPLFFNLRQLSLSLSDMESYSSELCARIGYHCPYLRFLKIGPVDERVGALVGRLAHLQRIDLIDLALERPSSLVAALGLCKYLQEVSITTRDRMTDDTLAQLSELPITRLSVESGYLTGKAFRQFRFKDRLKELSLTFCHSLDNRELVALRTMIALRKLSFVQTPLSLEGLACLAHIPSLRTLQVLRWQQVVSNEFVRNMGDRTAKALWAIPRSQALHTFSRLRQLQNLHVDHNICSTDEELRELGSNVPQFQRFRIDLFRTSITPQGIATFVKQVPQLATLEVGIERTSLDKVELFAEISALARVQNLAII